MTWYSSYSYSWSPCSRAAPVAKEHNGFLAVLCFGGNSIAPLGGTTPDMSVEAVPRAKGQRHVRRIVVVTLHCATAAETSNRSVMLWANDDEERKGADFSV